jgi:membrane dipeptidase
MNKYDVYDLHCDLPFYLAKAGYPTIFDPESRASILQLQTGGVKVQTMAIFTKTRKSSCKEAFKQLMCYKNMHTKYPEYFSPYTKKAQSSVKTVLAIENASGFCVEREALESGLKRLQKIVQDIEKPLYITLTWNTENRFGGGNSTKIGLKPDGKELIRLMAALGIGVDFSHTSDQLAFDILNFIEKEKLALPLLASHSNFRAIRHVERNLPNEIAKEIVRHKGVIGLNFIRKFLGEHHTDIVQHIAFALENGYENNLSLGADFFFEKSRSFGRSSTSAPPLFFEEFANAATYPTLLQLIEQKFSKKVAEKIASKNCADFFDRIETRLATNSRAVVD